MLARAFSGAVRHRRRTRFLRPPAGRSRAAGARIALATCLCLGLGAAGVGCGPAETAKNREAPSKAVPDTSGLSSPDSLSRGNPSIPIIGISKIDNQLTYRVHGEPISRLELDRLAANLASYSPDIPVILSPGPTITEDEIRMVTARLREQGLRNLRTVSRSNMEPGDGEEN